MMCRMLPILTLACALSATSAGPVFGQTVALSAELDPSSPTVRSGAPAIVLIKLTSSSQGLLEGSLEAELRDLGTTVSVSDLVLSTGPQRIKLTLPPLNLSNHQHEIPMQMTFRGKAATLQLGFLNLRVPTPLQRNLTIAVCDPWKGGNARAENSLVQGLRFEQFNPLPQSNPITTVAAYLRPEEMPQDALGWCSFDCALLVDQGLIEMREKQLEALREWIEAGGIACIAPGMQGDAVHTAFLNAIFDRTEGPFALDPSGRLSTDGIVSDGLLVRRVGLGKVALLVGASNWGERPEVLRNAAAALWRFRTDQIDAVRTTGLWDHVRATQLVQQVHNPYAHLRGDPNQVDAALNDAPGVNELLQFLMPSDVRVVPLWIIGLILIAYVALIGPVDWYLLGAFKLRKFTWVFFPAVTVAVTLFTIWLSHLFLDSAQAARRMVVVDLAHGNRVVRTNRFELLFTPSRRMVATDVKRAQFSGVYNVGPQYGMNSSDFRKPTRFEGRPPQTYRVLQDSLQWSPRVNRLLMFGAPDDLPAFDFDWDSLEGIPLDPPGKPVDSEGLSGRALAELKRVFGHDAKIGVYCRAELRGLNGSPELNQYGGTYQPNPYNPRQFNNQNEPFIKSITVHPPTGMFTLVSQVSPSGGSALEDTALLDPEDPSEWVLVVLVARGDDLYCFRRLYHSGEP